MTLEEVAEQLDIDLEPALERVVNNRKLYVHLLKVFIEDGDIDKAREAVADMDYESAEENIHSMKGAAISLGFVNMSEACQEMVNAMRRREYERIGALFSKVEKEYALVRDVIQQLTES